MSKFSKRSAPLGAVLAAAVLLPLAACGSSTSSGGAGASSSAAGGSTTLKITMANHPWTEAIKKNLPAFEQQTGLHVELSTYGEDQLSDQYKVKLNAGASDVDVMMYRPLQEGRLFAHNGWMADLTSKVKGAGGWNWNDFQSAARSAVTQDSKVTGVPIVTEQEILYYRKDLLAAAGLPVPSTLDELKSDAAKLAKNGTYGFVARGQRSAAVTQISSFLYSFGGDWAKDGKSSVDSPEAVQAFKFYGGLLKDYGPPGVTNMSWPQAIGIFGQGKAALYTDADSLYTNLTDPAKSRVQDKVGFAVFPAGPAGAKPYSIPSWALGVNAHSHNQANAWKFIQWATGQPEVLALQQAGVPGARTSVWDDPKGLSGFPAELAKVIQESSKIGVDHDRPMVVQVGKARDIVGAPIVTAIGGGNVDQAASQASSQFAAFLKDDAQLS